jgi:hypothetical protein
VEKLTVDVEKCRRRAAVDRPTVGAGVGFGIAIISIPGRIELDRKPRGNYHMRLCVRSVTKYSPQNAIRIHLQRS